jgi:hypothetical protein
MSDIKPPSCGDDTQTTSRRHTEANLTLEGMQLEINKIMKDFPPPVSTGNHVDGGGLRHNEGKIPVQLVPTSAITGIAKVLEAGMLKYPKDNWRRGMAWTTVYASLMRHLLKWMDGEDIDSETKCKHLDHVLCNAAFLAEYSETCPELDDRYKKVK